MDHKQLLDEIGRAANSKTTFLDLSNLGIYELPIEIGGLIGLESLNLAGNNLAALPREFARLTKLRFLDLRNNKFSDFPATVSSLKNLEFLNLALNNFLALPPSLYRLTNLRALDVSDNKLTTISPRIRNLVNLKSLDLSFNNLSSIPAEIAYPNRLSSLDLRNNHLEQLPVDIANLKHLEYLGLVNNNLNIPPEILDTKDVRELQNYLRVNYSGGRQALNELKIILVGQGSVGKTSLIRRLLKKPFNPQENKTDGIFIYQWMILVGEQEVRLNVWDFGGQEIMHATHQFFLTKRSLYILVLDSRLTQEENRVEYWLKIIQSFGGDSPVLIVGNKIDQHPLDIDRTGLPKKYTNTVGILETSAATGAGINELKAAIGAQVNNLPHVRDLLPETWFSVKTKLEELGHAFNFITHDKYLEICGRNKVIDEISQRTLIGFLHDLGVVLHFQDDPRLEALGILNPQWVTNGVYKILNSHALFDNKGVLTMSMLDEILNSPEYPRGKRLFIVDMMKKFELCYDLEADKTFLVPDLLPKTEPTVLKFAGIAAFEYGYPVLPSSIITRFIVRMNQKIHDGTVWRTGVLLKIGNNIALVKADIEDRKITIAIEGLEHTRRDALSAIRYQLDEIHNSIKGLDAQKLVPIPNAPNAEPLKYEYLLMLERAGQETHLIQDGNRLIPINVRQILSAIENEAQRKEQSGNVTNIYVGGNVDGNMIVGDQNRVNNIQNSFNKVETSNIQPELKRTLKQLTKAVEALTKSLPEEQAAEAAEDLSKLVDEATKPQPNKKWYSVSIDGLIKAAENVEKVGEPVINLSRKVLSLLTGGVVK